MPEKPNATDRKRAAAAVLSKIEGTAARLGVAMQRLRGIINSRTGTESADDTAHRLKSAVGYRKYVIKTANSLVASIQEASVVLDTME